MNINQADDISVPNPVTCVCVCVCLSVCGVHARRPKKMQVHIVMTHM